MSGPSRIIRGALLLLVLGGWAFPVQADTVAVVSAANSFLNTLTTAQKASVEISYTLALSEDWSNLPGVSRNGLTLGGGPVAFSTDLTTTEQASALTLISTAISSAGLNTMNEIRLADNVIRATGSDSAWNYGDYYIAILGTPSTTTPWMLQISGHHLTYNISYNAPQVSATPMFIGVEPPNYTILANGTPAR